MLANAKSWWLSSPSPVEKKNNLNGRAEGYFKKLIKEKASTNKWLMYKFKTGNVILVSLVTHTVVLTYVTNKSGNDVPVIPVPVIPVSPSVLVDSREAFDNISSVYIGKGNSYLYQEEGKPLESKVIPSHRSNKKEG